MDAPTHSGHQQQNIGMKAAGAVLTAFKRRTLPAEPDQSSPQMASQAARTPRMIAANWWRDDSARDGRRCPDAAAAVPRGVSLVGRQHFPGDVVDHGCVGTQIRGRGGSEYCRKRILTTPS